MIKSSNIIEIKKNLSDITSKIIAEREKFRNTDEYKMWEDNQEKLYNDIIAIGDSKDIKSIFEVESFCYRFDIIIFKKDGFTEAVHVLRQKLFQCLSIITLIDLISNDKYSKLVKKSLLHKSRHIPKHDAFVLLWVYLYRFTLSLYKQNFYITEYYDYSKYYKCRMRNMSIALREYRKWQKTLLHHYIPDVAALS